MTLSEHAIHPTVSIILPTYNRLKYLRDTVDSVFAQSYQDWELIVADDGSDEQTRAYLRDLQTSPRVKLLWLPHIGNHCIVRNAALRAATGEYVALLDSDDLWLPEKLAVQVAALRANPNCQWSYTASALVDEFGRPWTGKMRSWAWPEGHIFAQVLAIDVWISTASVVVARQLIDDIGGFDEAMRLHSDYDLWMRLALRSPVKAVQQPLALMRRHHEHYSGDRIVSENARLYSLKKVLNLVGNRELRAAVKSERVKSAAKLIGLHAAADDMRGMLRATTSTWRYSWPRIRWWRGVVRALLRLLAPLPLLRGWRRLRARFDSVERALP